MEEKIKQPAKTKTAVKLLDILDALPFYVLLVDENHYIVEANNSVYEHLGVHREDILQKYCPKVVHGYDGPFPGCPLEEAAENNQAVQREIRDEKNGRWISSAIYPTKAVTPDGKKIFLHVVYDITDSKQAREQLKVSNERLRNLSAHIETVREAEKRKIARDLHDETSQLLASLHAHIEAAIEILPGHLEKSVALLRKAQSLSTTVLDEVHNLIYELRPTILDELGLVAAVRSLIDTRMKSTGLKFSLKITGSERRLSTETETLLFRVAQEALTNIVKHARASNADIRLRFKKSDISIRIKDNGAGFNVEKTMSSRGRLGMGLQGMKERVELAKGRLNIISQSGKGTEIFVDVPYVGDRKDG